MLEEEEKIGFIFLVVLLLGLGGFFWWQSRAPEGPPPRWTGPIPVLPTAEELDVDMDEVVLGRRLYHDGILSGDGSVSCATCHSVEGGGAEPRRTSFGVNNALGPINAPTTLNAWNHVAQFWDGRAADLVEQAGGPVENPGEMAATFATVIPRIEEDEWYAQRFADVFPDRGITKETITEAIAAYETALLTPGPFDRWVAGDEEAMSEEAVAGYRLFVEVGCVSCHSGPAVGGTMFQKMGVVNDYFERRGGELTEADMGRFNHTGEESDRHFFKVPTLRNVALTAPYFHDGSETELAGAVRTMAHVQLGRELEDEQVAQLVAFLEALTGDLPEYALLPAAEVPPVRVYELPRPYDLRVVRDGRDVSARGVVPSEEMKARIVTALNRARLPRADVEGIVVDESASLELPESFEAALSAVATSARGLDRFRVDFVFGEENTLRLFGEGTEETIAAATEALTTAPEGFAWAEAAEILDGAAIAECDASLAAIQAEATITFEDDSTELTDEGTELLVQVPSLLAECPEDMRLLVAVHTDAADTTVENIGLSREQASALVDALVVEGVEPSRLIARGYGDTRPLGEEDSEEGVRVQRVELSLHRDY